MHIRALEYVYACVYVSVSMREYVHYVNMCVHVCMYVCVPVYVYVRGYLCV